MRAQDTDDERGHLRRPGHIGASGAHIFVAKDAFRLTAQAMPTCNFGDFYLSRKRVDLTRHIVTTQG
jgi:hypothetical protein